MQTKIFLSAALFSTVSLVIAESAPQSDAETTYTPQQTKLIHDVEVYISSVTAAPNWSSYSSIFAKSDSDALLGSNTKDFTDITANPSFTALPKDAQSYLVSLQNGLNSIVNEDLISDTPKPTSVATSMATGTAASTAISTGGTAPKPTGAVMAAGAAAAGLLGVVAML